MLHPIVTWRCRDSRLMAEGPVPSFITTTSDSGTWPSVDDGTITSESFVESVR